MKKEIKVNGMNKEQALEMFKEAIRIRNGELKVKDAKFI